MIAHSRHDAAAVLQSLVEGNRRFVAAMPRPVDAIESGKPRPRAAVLTCSDPRVSPPLLLHQPPGALFEVRTAGAVPTPSAVASLALGVGLGASVVMAAGHEDCAAVHRACALELAQAATPLAEAPVIGPVREVLDPSELRTPDRAIDGLVRTWVSRLASGPGLADPVEAGEVAVVGAVFEIPSGRLRLLDGNQPDRSAVDSR